jgi:MATE family multidrug resistance protein
MYGFRVALFILTVLSKQIMYLMHKESPDMAAPYIDWVASFDSSDYVSRVQAICGWSSQTKYSMYAIFMANVVHVF